MKEMKTMCKYMLNTHCTLILVKLERGTKRIKKENNAKQQEKRNIRKSKSEIVSSRMAKPQKQQQKQNPRKQRRTL